MRFLVDSVNATRRSIVRGVVRRAMAPVRRRLRLSRRGRQDAENADKADRGQPRDLVVRHSHHTHAVVKAARHTQLQDEWPETLIA